MLDNIIEKYSDESLIKADGFDGALIGIDVNSMRLIYSIPKSIQILCGDMSELDAIEYFNFNVVCAYIGDKTPIWCDDSIDI
jgi:hypothetical protein